MNFEILGEMDPNPKSNSSGGETNESHYQQQPQQQSKPIQNENIEPNKPNAPISKSFYNNKESQPVPKSSAPLTASSNQPGTFNSFKIYGISSLNPYQNKYLLFFD